MKAITIRYLGPTNTKGSRLKVSAPDLPARIVALDYALGATSHALQLAKDYADSYRWPAVKGFGQLANGTFVATMEEVK